MKIKMKMNNIYIIILLILIVIVSLSFTINKNKEGFYTSDNITSATTKLNEVLSNNLEQLKTVISDLTNQKYQISVNEVINVLNVEYGPDSKLGLPENLSTDTYLKTQIKNINTLQVNLNNINKKIDSLFETIKIDLIDINSGNTDTYNLLDAINKVSLDIKKTSTALSQIPP